MYTYYTSDLRSIPRNRTGSGRALDTHRAFTQTRTGAGIEFPGGRRMPDSDHDEPAMGAARGGPPVRNNAPYERTFKKGDLPNCDHIVVKEHMDVVAFVYHFMRALGLMFRWVITRGPIGRKLVTAEQLEHDNTREQTWMASNSSQRDLLEDELYKIIEKIWSRCTDALGAFELVGPDTPNCARAVFEQLLKTFPLSHAGMQMQLLSSHLESIMTFETNRDPGLPIADAVNVLFKDINELRKMLAYMPKQSVDDVLLAVTLAMLKASKLYDAYNKIRDDIDDGKSPTFESVRTACATKLRKHQPRPARTPRGDTPGTSPAKSTTSSMSGRTHAKSKWIQKGCTPEAAIYAAMLDRNGEKPKQVLREAGVQSFSDERAFKVMATACFPYFGPPSDGETDSDSGSDF